MTGMDETAEKPEQGEPEKHAGGRPTKYNDTMPERIGLFIEKCRQEDRLPTHAGFAVYVHVGKATVERWATEHPKFRDSLDEMNSQQEDTLINRGLKSEYNSTITKLMLSSNHGYKERTDSTSGDKPIAPVIVDFAKAKEQAIAEVQGDKSE